MTRTPENCAYRQMLPVELGQATHFCRLIQELTGAKDPALAAVRPDECTACCAQREATLEEPNAMVASGLFKALLRIRKAGGVEGCDAEKAEALKPFATDHLLVIRVPPSDPKSKNNSKTAQAYTSHCRHLGKQIGQRECKTCKGRVMQKEFRCHHPRHDSTTIMECHSCGDYQPGEGRFAVEKWAIGMTTAPRSRSTLRRSLRSLRRAGWQDRVYLFAEPQTRTWFASLGNGPLTVVRRENQALGAWGNFLLSLTELYLREPQADAYLIVQDDVEFCADMRFYLKQKLWPGPKPGVVSLHTPTHLAAASGTGFFKADLGRNAWGAQAFIFSNASARALLADAKVIDHRLKGVLGGMKNVDSVVGEWCRRTKHEFWLHAPSLVEHTGKFSTLWAGTKLEGRRKSADFPGAAKPLAELLQRHAQSHGAEAPQAITMLTDGTLAPMPEPTPVAAAGQPSVPVNFAEFWGSMSLDIVTISIGRVDVFDQWTRWLEQVELPPNASIILVDNTLPEEDARAKTLMHQWFSALALKPRFRNLTLVQGEGRSSNERTSDERVRNCATHYGLGFQRSTADFMLVLDDDVIPQMNAVRHLATAWHTLHLQGRKPALVSGCYESARSPGILVAGRDLTAWRDQPKVGEITPGQLQQIGFVGLGCALIHAPARQQTGPFDLAAIHGWAGPDAWLCQKLKQRGHTLWLDGNVHCQHLHSAKA